MRVFIKHPDPAIQIIFGPGSESVNQANGKKFLICIIGPQKDLSFSKFLRTYSKTKLTIQFTKFQKNYKFLHPFSDPDSERLFWIWPDPDQQHSIRKEKSWFSCEKSFEGFC